MLANNQNLNGKPIFKVGVSLVGFTGKFLINQKSETFHIAMPLSAKGII